MAVIDPRKVRPYTVEDFRTLTPGQIGNVFRLIGGMTASEKDAAETVLREKFANDESGAEEALQEIELWS